MSQLAFIAFSLNGIDAQKFLQGQVTVHIERLAENESRYTAICDLKGRIHFGLWIKNSILKVLSWSPLKIKQKNLPNTFVSLVPSLK
jgi:folate-binding Fe-S cluster repair protein YgfZ